MTNNDFMIAYNKSAVAKQYDLLAINCASSPALTALLKSSFRFDLLCFTPDQVISKSPDSERNTLTTNPGHLEGGGRPPLDEEVVQRVC